MINAALGLRFLCIRMKKHKKFCVCSKILVTLPRNFLNMINRTMVRTRVIQSLFAYYENGDITPTKACKELVNSFSSTYSLYMMMLAFADEFATFAEQQISENIARARATHRPYTPNRKFVENTFSKQIFSNRALRHYMTDHNLSWDGGLDAFPTLLRQLQEQPYYQDYMSSPDSSYEEDKALWRKIYTDLLPGNEALNSALEELEVVLDMTNWTTDIDIILSYIFKTIKRFQEDNGADQELLPIFDSEDELQFGQTLLREAIAHKEEYDELIAAHLKNWDPTRIAFMDRIILYVSLAEIATFDEIALEVSLNEYIELAKEYSGEKSYLFINGILDEILRELKEKNKLVKSSNRK